MGISHVVSSSEIPLSGNKFLVFLSNVRISNMYVVCTGVSMGLSSQILINVCLYGVVSFSLL